MGFWDYVAQKTYKAGKTAGNFLTQNTQKMGRNLGETFSLVDPYVKRTLNQADRQAEINRQNQIKLIRNSSGQRRQALVRQLNQPQDNYYKELGITNKTPLQVLGEAGGMATEALGFGQLKGVNVASKIPVIGKAVNSTSKLKQLGGYSALRGLEGAGYGALTSLGEGNTGLKVAKDAAIGGVMGAGANAVLSPRLLKAAGKEMYLNDKAAIQAAKSGKRTFGNPQVVDKAKRQLKILDQSFRSLNDEAKKINQQADAALKSGYVEESTKLKIQSDKLLRQALEVKNEMNSNLAVLKYNQPIRQGGYVKLEQDDIERKYQELSAGLDLSNSKSYGKQVINNIDGERQSINVGNAYPEWVPQEYRKKELVNKVLNSFDGNGNPIRPSGKSGELYDLMHGRDNTLDFLNVENTPGKIDSALDIAEKRKDTPMFVRTEKKATLQMVKDKGLKREINNLLREDIQRTVDNTATEVGKKVGGLDIFRTPDRVLKKIGLENESKRLRKAWDKYKSELPGEINKVSKWASQTTQEENVNIFKYLCFPADRTLLPFFIQWLEPQFGQFF